jgi:hypothetical protein
MSANPRRTRPGGVGAFFPGAAEVGGERAGEQQLGGRGHDQAYPAVGLLGGADLRGCKAEVSLGEAEGVLLIEAGQVGAP